MLRLDFEEPGDLAPEEERQLLDWLQKRLQEGLDGIVLSDYAKGVCSDHFCQTVIDLAHSARCRCWWTHQGGGLAEICRL